MRRLIKIQGFGISRTTAPVIIEAKINEKVVYFGEVDTHKKASPADILHKTDTKSIDVFSWVENSNSDVKKMSITVHSGIFLYTKTLTTLIGHENLKDPKLFDSFHYKDDNGVIISDPNSNILIDGVPYNDIPKNRKKMTGQWRIVVPEKSTMSCDVHLDQANWDSDSCIPTANDIVDFFYSDDIKKKEKIVSNYDISLNDFFERHRIFFETYQHLKKKQMINTIISEGGFKAVYSTNDNLNVIKIDKSIINNYEQENYNFLIQNNLQNIIPKTSFFKNFSMATRADPLTRKIAEENDIFFYPRSDDGRVVISEEKNKIIFSTIQDTGITNFGILNGHIVLLDLGCLKKEIVIENLNELRLGFKTKSNHK